MPAKTKSLKREASLFQLVAYGIGNIIGAGIYVLVGAASGLAGNAIWLSFFIGAFVAMFTGLSYAELGALYPKAASEYTYVGRAYGNRALSFVTEWTMLLTEIVAAATVSLGFAEYFQSVFVFPVTMVAAFMLLGLTALVMMGIKSSLKINTTLSIIAILGLLIVVAAAVGKFGTIDYGYSPQGISGIMAGTILVFFAYIGFDNIANLSEETKDPSNNIPKGLLIALGVSTLLYILVGIAAVSLVPFAQLSTSNAPLALAASQAFGPIAYNVLTAAALLTTINTVLVLLIVGSRIVYGMARENAIPNILARLNSRHAPYAASIAVLLVALAFVSLGKIDMVARVTSFGSLITFALINLAMIHLRRTAPNLKRGFKAPFSIGTIPVTGLLGVLTCLALITQFDLLSAVLGMILPISGVAMYLLMGNRKLFGVDAKLLEKNSAR